MLATDPYVVDPRLVPLETVLAESEVLVTGARIAPVLEQADEPSADRLLVRVAAEEALRRRFPAFARDYEHYVGQVAAQLEAASGL